MSLNIHPPKDKKSLLDSTKYCPHHACPTLTVLEGKQETSMCLHDIIAQTIGGQRVKYVKTASGSLKSIQFDNGYILKPLCPHCGEATILDKGFLEGKTLLEWSWEMEEFVDGEYPSVVLYFGRAEDEISDSVSVHLDSIVHLQKAQK